MAKEKLNCWEFMQCGRGPGESQEKGKEPCVATMEKGLHRVHGGVNSGRACWVVAGTYCGGSVQGDFAKKIEACKGCDFYQQVYSDEGEHIESAPALEKKLQESKTRLDITTKKLGVMLGGAGLIGGALMHYFKTKTSGEIEVLSPNSKKLSLRESEDIKQYITKYQPDFIINCAIASIDSDAQLAYETNCMGTIGLAKMATALKIPYIHFSSAAAIPMGENLVEGDQLPLQPKMSNYAKSKLMAEKILDSMHKNQGLDYTIIRLAVVYGKHDHKIQGFHRMLFSIADQSMPVILSKKGVFHSYTHTKKIPPFVSHILNRREEFGGQTYNFVDPEPVELVQLIKAIKTHLKFTTPREICIPYPLAKMAQRSIRWLINRLGKVGVEIRLPAELMFLKNFYQTQTLSAQKLINSSFVDPFPESNVFTELPSMLEYYITRWRHLNRITAFGDDFYKSTQWGSDFVNSPQSLLETIIQEHKESEFKIK